VKNLQPTGFELEPGTLSIRWSDGSISHHSMELLRKQCPCATCRAERDKIESPKGLSSLRVIQSGTPAVTQAQILKVLPVGRYALTFHWNDGHQTGIYAYDFLLQNVMPAKA
jgi:DUF971 family protein